MCSDAMIYTPNFTKIGSGVQKLLMGTHIHRHTHTDRKPALILFQNKEYILLAQQDWDQASNNKLPKKLHRKKKRNLGWNWGGWDLEKQR
jgi:hypothetical protein